MVDFILLFIKCWLILSLGLDMFFWVVTTEGERISHEKYRKYFHLSVVVALLITSVLYFLYAVGVSNALDFIKWPWEIPEDYKNWFMFITIISIIIVSNVVATIKRSKK